MDSIAMLHGVSYLRLDTSTEPFSNPYCNFDYYFVASAYSVLTGETLSVNLVTSGSTKDEYRDKSRRIANEYFPNVAGFKDHKTKLVQAIKII